MKDNLHHGTIIRTNNNNLLVNAKDTVNKRVKNIYLKMSHCWKQLGSHFRLLLKD